MMYMIILYKQVKVGTIEERWKREGGGGGGGGGGGVFSVNS